MKESAKFRLPRLRSNHSYPQEFVAFAGRLMGKTEALLPAKISLGSYQRYGLGEDPRMPVSRIQYWAAS